MAKRQLTSGLALCTGVFLLACGTEFAQAGYPNEYADFEQAPLLKTPPSMIALTDEMKDELTRAGKTFMKDVPTRRGSAVFKVKASPEKVWQTITKYECYAKWIPKLTKSDEYKVPGDDANTRRINFYLDTGFPFFKYNYHIIHHLNEGDKWIRWARDDAKTNDLESLGFWRLAKADNNSTLIMYHVKITKPESLPGFLVNMLLGSALDDATKWVTKHAEAPGEPSC